MKKFFLLGLFIIAILITTIFIVARKNPNKPLSVVETVPVTGPKKFGDVAQGVVFTYIGPSVLLPVALPTYIMSYPSDLPDRTAALAKQWGFTAALSRPVPYVYDWIDNNKHLSYNDQSKNISFSLFSSGLQIQPLALTTQDVFSSLLSSRFLSDDFSFIETNRQTILPEGEGGDTSGAPLTVITYQSKIKDRAFPFFFSSVTRTTGEMRINPSGKVVSFSFYATAKIKPEQERQVLDLNQIIQELNSGKGYLTGLSENASGYTPDVSPSFAEVKISSITPAFLFVPEESRFVPIYMIEGDGYGQKVQRVRYFLRASS